ncbi:MAG: hypothetical protein ACKO96_12295, partial [Flammeovirgaceae bacterium]
MKLFVAISLFVCMPLVALADADSTQSKKQIPSAHWRINSRMHSKGIFTYGGWLGSDNPTFDVNLIYERK